MLNKTNLNYILIYKSKQIKKPESGFYKSFHFSVGN